MKEESHEEESEDDYETRTAQASMCTKGCVHMCICDYKLRTKWIAPYQVDGSVFCL